MQLKFKKGRVEIDMSYYLRKVIQEFMDLQIERLPGKKNLFKVDKDSPLLMEDKIVCFIRW
jgi:hypothetical protein